MATDVSMYRHLKVQLSGADLAMARGIVFVDVFDGEDGIVRVQGTGFFDADKGKTCQKIILSGKTKLCDLPGICALADCFGDDSKGHVVWQRGQLRVLHGGSD